MMRRAELPEARLLNLIKRKNRKAAVKNIFTKMPHAPDFLKSINKYLAVSLGIVVCYLAYFIVFPPRYKGAEAQVIQTLPSVNNGSADKNAGVSAKPEDYSKYSSIIGEKQLFDAGNAAVESHDVMQSGSVSNNFSLVGIIPGDNPQAVIEDKAAGKTYYLYKGASINGAVVQEITNGKVVLDYNGESVSLVL